MLNLSRIYAFKAIYEDLRMKQILLKALSTMSQSDYSKARRVITRHSTINDSGNTVKKIEPYFTSPEDLNDKLTFLRERLSLTQKELDSLIVWQPMMIGRTKEEIIERIEYFQNQWNFSLDDIKELFITEKAKKIQLQSFPELQLMHNIFINKFNISPNEFKNKLYDWNYWNKYRNYMKRQYSKSQNGTTLQSITVLRHSFIEKRLSMHRTIIRQYFRKYDLPQLPYKIVEKLIKLKIFEKNPRNLLDQKLKLLIESLQLNSKQLKSFLTSLPMLLNETLSELQERIHYFTDFVQCSKDECQYLFLKRPTLVRLPTKALYIHHTLLSTEYDFISNKDLKIMLYHTQYPVSEKLHLMIKDLVERKYLLNLLFPDSTTLKKTIKESPNLLWMSPKMIYEVIDAFIEGIGINSFDELNCINAKAFKVDRRFLKFTCRHFLSLLMKSTDIDNIRSQVILCPEETISTEMIDLQHQYDRLYKLPSHFVAQLSKTEEEEDEKVAEGEEEEEGENEEKEANKKDIMYFDLEDETYKTKIRNRCIKVYEAFIEEKKRSISDKQPEDTDLILELCFTAATLQVEMIPNEYYRLLVEVFQKTEVDLLVNDEIFHKDSDMLLDALRSRIADKKTGKFLQNNDLRLAVSISAAKEIEKINFSHDVAKKICLQQQLYHLLITTTLPKLSCLAVCLQLTSDEMMSIFSRAPR